MVNSVHRNKIITHNFNSKKVLFLFLRSLALVVVTFGKVNKKQCSQLRYITLKLTYIFQFIQFMFVNYEINNSSTNKGFYRLENEQNRRP